jgi:histidine triad (HIT) family protein
VTDCVFCRIGSGEASADRLYEDERTLAFLDIHPAGEGHTLIIPKEHAQDVWDVDPELWEAVWRTSHHVATAIGSAFAPDGLYVRQANGPLGGQEVMHLHVHLIPRYASGRAPGLASLSEVAERIRAAL